MPCGILGSSVTLYIVFGDHANEPDFELGNASKIVRVAISHDGLIMKDD